MKKCNIAIMDAKTKEGKLYLSVVVEQKSRYVLGHAFGKVMDEDLVARAVDSVELVEELELQSGKSLGLFPNLNDYLKCKKPNTYEEAVEALERYIVFYNDVRVHEDLGCEPKMML